MLALQIMLEFGLETNIGLILTQIQNVEECVDVQLHAQEGRMVLIKVILFEL